MFPGLVDTSADDVTEVKPESAGQPDQSGAFNTPSADEPAGKVEKGDEVEQDALYQRRKRSAKDRKKTDEISKKSAVPLHGAHKLLQNPFWDMKFDDSVPSSPRSKIAVKPTKKQFMSGMLHKRWKIPGNWSISLEVPFKVVV